MTLREQWREFARKLEEAEEKRASAQTAEELSKTEALFTEAESHAKELFSRYPEVEGKQPYEGDLRTCTAGRLLSGVLLRVQQLRDGSIPKEVARQEIKTMAASLLNLRADHGRFFDTTLNNGINQIERLYQKLLQQRPSISPD